MKLQNAGRNLRIRAVRPDDADWLAQTWSDREFVALYCSNIQPVEADALRQALVEREGMPAETLGFVEFVVERPGGERIGIGTLGNYAAQHRRAELMIGIVDPQLRRGLAGLEATLLLLDLAFNSYGLNKVFTYVYGYNDFSEANTLRLGFRQEGLLREHHWQTEEQRFVDLFINGMTRTDFRRADQLARWSRRLLGRDITREPVVVRPATELDLATDTRAKLLSALATHRPATPSADH